MIGVNHINKELLVAPKDELDENLVAVAVQLNDEGTAFHSGILIGIDGDFWLFHYTGTEVELNETIDPTEPLYCKRIEFVEDYEVINFKALCEILLNDVNPRYGLLFDGSFFKDGTYYTESGLPFITTCVGFCLMTFKSFLINTDFLQTDDWDEESAEGFRNDYVDFYELTLRRIEQENPEMAGEIAKKYVKRITPSEYASAGFYSDLPIRKDSIDAILNDVQDVLKEKAAG